MTHRRFTRSTLLAATVGLGLASPATAQIGIAGGYNRDYLSDIDLADTSITVASAEGFHFGIFFNVNLLILAIRPAVYFHRVNDLSIATATDSTSFDLDLIEIPLDLRLRLPLPIVKPYLLAGAVIGFPSSDNAAIDASMSSSVWRADVGVGIELNVGIRLWPEVRFGLGITDYFKDGIPIGDDIVVPTGKVRLDSFMVRLGISF